MRDHSKQTCNLLTIYDQKDIVLKSWQKASLERINLGKLWYWTGIQVLAQLEDSVGLRPQPFLLQAQSYVHQPQGYGLAYNEEITEAES